MLFIAIAALAAAPAVQAETPGEAPAGYRLVWADEFDRDGLVDAGRWTYDVSRNREGWWNNEQQYYAPERLENVRVEDGRLVIEATKERLSDRPDFGGQDYASGKIISRAAWTYGVIDTRAKLPCGRGTWPAIWMLPEQAGEWPRDGEIDIMEHVGHRPGVVHGTIHTQAYNHVAHTENGGEVRIADACDAFHDYRVTWTPDRVAFAVDGRDYHVFDNDHAGRIETWPFDTPFRLILNVAVGGDWGGAEGVDDDALPQRMEIDWVRVYQPVGEP